MERFFQLTAWPMVPPRPWSAFHLLLAVPGVWASCVLAVRMAAQKKNTSRVLFSCGLLLTLMELYKQGFLFYIENDHQYNWWYFPFQLCTIPMYLCLCFPRFKSPCLQKAAAEFLKDFGFLGGIMALLVPPGLMHPYWTMTLHGFVWHFILIFAGVFCAASPLTDAAPQSFFKTLPLFFSCCLIALLINGAAGPMADADMFYLSPYHPSSQPVFHQISSVLGIFPGILLYILAMTLGGYLVHRLWGVLM